MDKLKNLSAGQLAFLLHLIETEDHIARAHDLGPAAVRGLVESGYIVSWAKVYGPQVWVLNVEFSNAEVAFMRSTV